MANTYTQIHLQFVFAVKHRGALIQPDWEEELFKYITGIVQNNGHKLLAINGMPDHLHMFIGYRVSQSIPKLVETIKTRSNQFINQRGFCRQKFEWQTGYGCFSYGKSQVNQVIQYVRNQKSHHRKTTFQTEYRKMLQAFQVEFNEQFLFDFLDE